MKSTYLLVNYNHSCFHEFLLKIFLLFNISNRYTILSTDIRLYFHVENVCEIDWSDNKLNCNANWFHEIFFKWEYFLDAISREINHFCRKLIYFAIHLTNFSNEILLRKFEIFISHFNYVQYTCLAVLQKGIKIIMKSVNGTIANLYMYTKDSINRN